MIVSSKRIKKIQISSFVEDFLIEFSTREGTPLQKCSAEFEKESALKAKGLATTKGTLIYRIN